MRPAGWSCAFWNSRAQAGLSANYDLVLHEFSSEYERLKNGRTTLEELRAHLDGMLDDATLDVGDLQTARRVLLAHARS